VGGHETTIRDYQHIRCGRFRRAGFTLVDILVSIAIIAVLIGILLPSLAMVRATSEKVVCASNIRQAGLGLHMYAMDNGDYLPQSVFADFGSDWNTTPLQLRVDIGLRGVESNQSQYWDGLGHLIGQNYLSDGRIFFCPSHLGENTFESFRDQFNGLDGDIVANYQYRGVGPNGEQRLDQFQSSVALVSDGFRTLDEINHPNGMNVLRAGMGVSWFRDTNLTAISNTILGPDGDEEDSWRDRWDLLDQPQRPMGWSLFD
jgi:type II secretory pathway pseudopilin PulG